ncbi:formate-dependent nitrite reductase complex subunit NrfG [Labrenzia sp. THAF82]|uniref:c-type cytochrome biogenesis protein CcmI n=1 Tax=Labrenzia sp. THAF82 TaxID=2587861 RepID=UPI00126857EC|nr:c-type cytochrome biogenesis protein CcmI [Labrenzia sp. THAF82]QFT33130.1 formate-dependent nitrite reductase complex subunit NrfG [Labrenzia sp. THAF82]
MMFWILIAALTAAATLAVLVPLSRNRQPADAASKADEAVYREQLETVDRDLKRGLIEPEAAEAARTEIARRLLSANERQTQTVEKSERSLQNKIAIGLAIVFLPAATFGLYILLGSPDQPDQPLSARLEGPAQGQSVDVLVARVERHLAENPEDGQGWAVIAPVYMSIGQPESSARAYANALRIVGPNADWLTDMGEALTIANQGLVTADARKAFDQAVSLQPEAVKPRFFLAMALGQEGRTDEAIAAWEQLLDGEDETQAWVGAARAQLAELQGTAPPLANRPGPTEEDVAATSDMTAEDRQTMIQGMVSGLAERLSAEGGSVDEWNQLMRAYMVLGEKQKAETALKDALTAYAENPDDLSLIKDAADQLGLTGS